MIPKPKRIKNPRAIEAARKPYCEYCGCLGTVHVHHIKTKGSGGHDIPENLISLCPLCHDKAHWGQISKEALRGAKDENRDYNIYLQRRNGIPRLLPVMHGNFQVDI